MTCSEEQYRWTQANYRQNTLHEDEKIYRTYSGIMVRSKSEQTIGNELELSGVPYRYEMVIQLDVSWMDDAEGLAMGPYKTYSPDFIILTAAGKYIVWEHLGRLDQHRYRLKNDVWERRRKKAEGC